MKVNPLVQLEELLATCSSVAIERTLMPCEYEVTVYRGRDQHSHYGGASLAEAINRACKDL